MFAIEISEENMEKIAESGILTIERLNAIGGVYLPARANYYFVRGFFVDSEIRWTVLPEFILSEEYNYDPDKIKTDWDQIVRK
jgi:hypothetical protein